MLYKWYSIYEVIVRQAISIPTMRELMPTQNLTESLLNEAFSQMTKVFYMIPCTLVSNIKSNVSIKSLILNTSLTTSIEVLLGAKHKMETNLVMFIIVGWQHYKSYSFSSFSTWVLILYFVTIECHNCQFCINVFPKWDVL